MERTEWRLLTRAPVDSNATPHFPKASQWGSSNTASSSAISNLKISRCACADMDPGIWYLRWRPDRPRRGQVKKTSLYTPAEAPPTGHGGDPIFLGIALADLSISGLYTYVWVTVDMPIKIRSGCATRL